MKAKYSFYMNIRGNEINAEITENISNFESIVTYYNDYRTIDVAWVHIFINKAMTDGMYEPYYDLDDDGNYIDCVWCRYDFTMDREELYDILY